MTKQATKSEVNSFIGGFVTEASPLNFPPNATLDEINFELKRDGTRQRRLGFDHEPNDILWTIPGSVDSILNNNPVAFLWTEAGGTKDKNIVVCQFGNWLMFFDANKESLSGEGILGQTNISSFPSTVQFSFASIDGRLVIAAGVDTVAVVEFVAIFNFPVTYHRLRTRDLWGVEVPAINGPYETDPFFRGTGPSGFEQVYNWRNQSWAIPRKDSAGNPRDPIELYFAGLGKFPSNSEVVWTGLQFQPVSSGTPFERVYPSFYDDVFGADIVSPKGFFVIDVLKRGTSRQEEYASNSSKFPILLFGTVSLPLDYTPNGPSAICEFAGRIFYGGFSGEVQGGDARSPNLSNYVFFSQIARSKNDIFKCYQEGDPTSRENSDIVDTDGGWIRIAGAENIIKMIGLGTDLVVIAGNGVWAINGGSDFGFSATNYKVSKLSSVGGLGPYSVVEEGGRAFFWSIDGIGMIGRDQFGSLQVQLISEASIQSYYNTLPITAKQTAIGVYDRVDKKIRWMFSTGDLFSQESERFELIFDVPLGAFYKFKINGALNGNIQVACPFQCIAFTTSVFLGDVVVNNDPVLADGEAVVIGQSTRGVVSQTVKYMVVAYNPVGPGAGVTFGYYRNLRFQDWEDMGFPVDAPGFLLTGAITGGDSSLDKQTPYVVTHMKRTELGVDEDGNTLLPSGCLMRAQWNWTNKVESNKWSPLQQIYRFKKQLTLDDGFDVITTRNKVRGQGKAVSLYFETEPLKDCRLLGWNITANANPIT